MTAAECGRPGGLLLVVGMLVALVSCTDNTARREATAPQRESLTQKGLGPGPTAEFETLYAGEVLPGRNSWELGVRRGREARFTVRMRIRDGGLVCRSTFHVSEFGAPSNETVRQLRDDPRRLAPGTYSYPLSWDGTGDGGELLPPGRYRLSAVLRTDPLECGNRPSTTEGNGLGELLLGDTEGAPRYVPPVPL